MTTDKLDKTGVSATGCDVSRREFFFKTLLIAIVTVVVAVSAESAMAGGGQGGGTGGSGTGTDEGCKGDCTSG